MPPKARAGLPSSGNLPLYQRPYSATSPPFSPPSTSYKPPAVQSNGNAGVSACMNSRKRGGCSRTLRPLSGPLHRGGGRRHSDRPPLSVGLEALSCSHKGTRHRAFRRLRLDMPACPELGALGDRQTDLLGQSRSPSLTVCGGSGSQRLRTTHDHLSATRPCV